MSAVEFRPSLEYDTLMSDNEIEKDEFGNPIRRTGRPPHGRLAKRRMTLRLDPALDGVIDRAITKFADQIENVVGTHATGEGTSIVLQAALEQSKFAHKFAECLKDAGL